MKHYINKERVENKMNTTNIQNITITGLFGNRTISLDFCREVNIYIGENGLGKTTILNCVYYLLSKNYKELLNIDFVSISIRFKGDKEYSINQADIFEYYSRDKNHHRFFSVNEDTFEEAIKSFLDDYNTIDRVTIKRLSEYLSEIFDMPKSIASNLVFNYINNPRKKQTRIKGEGDKRKVEELDRAIECYVGEKIEYFTTYRRIENDFSNIFNKEIFHSEKDSLIKFGMSDVQKQIDSNLNSIKTVSIENFNRMTSILLKEYSTKSTTSDYNNSKYSINRSVLKVILDRLGNQIEDRQKKRILDLFDSNDLYSKEYAYLLNLIYKLIDSYNEQKIYDDRIKNFFESCNRYLNGKRFVYNPSELKLNIELENNNFIVQDSNNSLPLSNLSSGEKQIVSLFSKLYLDDDKKCILIIDEPELSLSMHWQKMLIPDIMRSNNCKLLLTVTHSPFIFDNEFDKFAKEMRNSLELFEER